MGESDEGDEGEEEEEEKGEGRKVNNPISSTYGGPWLCTHVTKGLRKRRPREGRGGVRRRVVGNRILGVNTAY